MPNLSDFISCSLNLCQHNGQCLLDNSSIANFTCLCTKCFTGSICEMEKYSGNLWYMGISDDKRFKNHQLIETIVGFLLAIVSFLSSFLAVQTFLCSKKIRITNLGVYLILFSFSCLIVSIIRGVFAFVAFLISTARLGSTYKLFQCAVMRLFASSLICCFFWLLLFIAIERILIEYSFFNLYDSRRRSLISSLCLYTIVPVTNILVNIYGRQSSHSFADFCQLNYTSTGYIFYSIIRWINYLVAPIALFISFLLVLHHLLRHRLHYTADSSSIGSSIKLVILNHQDFIVQPLVFTLCVMPYFITGHLMTCSKADTHAIGKLTTIFSLLSDSALAMTFFMTVSSSKFYMQEFWNKSYVGRFLLYIKDRSCTSTLRQCSVSSISSNVFDTVI
jgi:hypothetical protein